MTVSFYRVVQLMPALGQQILGNTNPYMGPALIEYIGLARTDTAYSFEIFCNQTQHEHCAHFNRLHKERCVHKVQYHSISPHLEVHHDKVPQLNEKDSSVCRDVQNTETCCFLELEAKPIGESRCC